MTKLAKSGAQLPRSARPSEDRPLPDLDDALCAMQGLAQVARPVDQPTQIWGRRDWPGFHRRT
jgi:hypothetical protein